MAAVARHRANASTPDLAEVRSWTMLAACLMDLKEGTGRSYARIARLSSTGKHAVSKSTVENLAKGKGTPSRESLMGFLDGCGIASDVAALWLSTWDRLVRQQREVESSREVQRPIPSRPGATRRAQHVPFMAPPDIAYFVGREGDLKALRENTRSANQARVMGLYGMGGIGKTALAIRFAHIRRDDFPGGVLWAHLDKSTTGDILYAFAQAYGLGTELIHLSGDEKRVAFMQSVLTQQRPLVVLDNAANSAQLEPLIRAAANCPIIVTARQASIAALRDAAVIDLDPLSPGESRELLRELLGEQQADLSASNEIGELTGHLPLALRIVAARAQRSRYPLYELARRLKKRRLGELNYGRDAGRDTSVRSSFELTYNDLKASDRSFFAALGALGGIDFSVDAAAHVTASSYSSAEQCIEGGSFKTESAGSVDLQHGDGA